MTDIPIDTYINQFSHATTSCDQKIVLHYVLCRSHSLTGYPSAFYFFVILFYHFFLRHNQSENNFNFQRTQFGALFFKHPNSKPLFKFAAKVIVINFNGSASVIWFGSFRVHELKWWILDWENQRIIYLPENLKLFEENPYIVYLLCCMLDLSRDIWTADPIPRKCWWLVVRHSWSDNNPWALRNI